MELSLEQAKEYTNMVRKKSPVVHCITNIVTANDCANILLAAGALPTMAHHPMEVAEVASHCDALVCNLGATESLDAMKTAAIAAQKAGHPIVIDPVGTAGITFRRNYFWELTDAVKPSCVRGNFSEIKALVEGRNTSVGVDADKADILLPDGSTPLAGTQISNADDIVRQLSQTLSCIVIASGATDIISDGNSVFHVTQGSSMMSKITGTGCMSSALLGAYLACSGNIKAAVSACTVMGFCGETAAKDTMRYRVGTMTFRAKLIDAISLL
ncbi:MAG: hydroxyethylthiazole kinase [Butyribacter sp.]|nr:hydroxyethylthiazole kinase [bacterium]MDY3854095.1 hydroxyethylthiazole kinase [Butyribacter sp.]